MWGRVGDKWGGEGQEVREGGRNMGQQGKKVREKNNKLGRHRRIGQKTRGWDEGGTGAR